MNLAILSTSQPALNIANLLVLWVLLLTAFELVLLQQLYFLLYRRLIEEASSQPNSLGKKKG